MIELRTPNLGEKEPTSMPVTILTNGNYAPVQDIVHLRIPDQDSEMPGAELISFKKISHVFLMLDFECFIVLT